MRAFYLNYANCQSVTGNLSWRHYCEVLGISDKDKRHFYEVEAQQRVTINNTHYYVDMVFYNKLLRSYVLIELKTTKLMPEAAGQLNMYLNYYENEVNDEDDNESFGIILCTDKDALTARYADIYLAVLRDDKIL